MSTRQIMSKGFWVWYIASSLILVIALGSVMEGQAWWKVIPVLIAFVSLVWGAGCWFCKRSREVLALEMSDSSEQPSNAHNVTA